MENLIKEVEGIKELDNFTKLTSHKFDNDYGAQNKRFAYYYTKVVPKV